MGMSDRILCILEVNQISRAEFARRLQITQAYVSKLINKGAEPSSRLIEDICEKFRVSETWFRTGEGEMGGKQMPLLKTQDYTIHDVYALPEGKRAELINGQMYLMAPPNRMHQEIDRKGLQRRPRLGDRDRLPLQPAYGLYHENYPVFRGRRAGILDRGSGAQQCHGLQLRKGRRPHDLSV